MTDDQRKNWEYLYQERLGILCEDREPTEEQKRIAKEEANAWLASELNAELI